MTDDQVFLDTLKTSPADDTARLVYADWLDDRADPRAEYLRLQVQLAETAARLAELGDGLDPSWVAAVRWPLESAGAFKLRSGHEVGLTRLEQAYVDTGLFKDVPTRERNRQIIDAMLDGERRRSGAEPYLIRPEDRPIQSGDDAHPLAHDSYLPSVACRGYFQCPRPVRDMIQDCSALTIIWFQDEFAFPLDPLVREQLLAIEWERFATDHEY